MSSIIVVGTTVINLAHLIHSEQKVIQQSDPRLIEKYGLTLTQEELALLKENIIIQKLYFIDGKEVELTDLEDIKSFLEQCKMKMWEVSR